MTVKELRTCASKVVLRGEECSIGTAFDTLAVQQHKARYTARALQLVNRRRNAEIRNLARRALRPATLNI